MLHGVRNDPFVDAGKNLFAETFAKVGHHGVMKRWLCAEPREAQKVVQIGILANLLDRLSVGDP